MPTLKHYDSAAFLLFILASIVYGYHYFFGTLTDHYFYGYLVFGLAYACIRLYRLLTTDSYTDNAGAHS